MRAKTAKTAIKPRAEAEVTLIRPPSEVKGVASRLLMPEPGLTDVGHGQEPRIVWRIFDTFDGRRNHLFEGDESEPQRGDAPARHALGEAVDRLEHERPAAARPITYQGRRIVAFSRARARCPSACARAC